MFSRQCEILRRLLAPQNDSSIGFFRSLLNPAYAGLKAGATIALRLRCAVGRLENNNGLDMANLQFNIEDLLATSGMGNEWQPEK